MTDERMEELLGAWMKASVAPEPEARESARAVLERLDGADAGARWTWRPGGSVAPYPQAATALALIALAGAFLLLNMAPTDPAPERPQHVIVGASQSPASSEDATDPADPAGPSIHWQTDEVDLRAAAMRLRIGDTTYTGRDAAFQVEASAASGGGGRLSVAWVEYGQEHELEFHLGSDGDDWRIYSIKHERPDIYGPDGARYGGVTWLDDTGDLVPLAQTASGDLRVSSTTRMPTCEPRLSNELEVTLELSGLELAVHPKDPSPLEALADRLLGPRSAIGRAIDPPPEPQPRYVELECPAPDPVAVGVAGWDLLAEPVGTGAWRVLGDGVHDLDETIVDVAVAPDGSTVLATMDRLLWLGSDAPLVDVADQVPWPNRVDVTPTGDLLLQGGERQYAKGVMVQYDDEGFAALPGFSPSDARASGGADVFDPSWDAEGTLWMGVTGGVVALADGAWDYHSRYEYSPLAASSAAVSYGATKAVAAAPDGDIWIGSGPTFTQRHDGRWIEHDPLRTVIESLPGSEDEKLFARPIDLKIDDGGTMWGLTDLSVGGRAADATLLVRRIGDEWTVYDFDSVTPDEGLESQHIAAHDGAVYLLVVQRARGPGAGPYEPRLLRFDGQTTTELARLPAGMGYRIADVGPDGTVWIVGGSAEGSHADRLHVVAPQPETTGG